MTEEHKHECGCGHHHHPDEAHHECECGHNHEEELITIIDEEGNETLYHILFTFDSQDYQKNYVVVYPHGTDNDDEVEIQVISYKEDDD